MCGRPILALRVYRMEASQIGHEERRCHVDGHTLIEGRRRKDNSSATETTSIFVAQVITRLHQAGSKTRFIHGKIK